MKSKVLQVVFHADRFIIRLLDAGRDGIPGEEADKVLVLRVFDIKGEILEVIRKPRVHCP